MQKDEVGLLQILADQDFAVWRRFLKVRHDQEDDLYRVLYESWESRVGGTPPVESESEADLVARLQAERSSLLGSLKPILSESQLGLMRTTLEEGHRRIVGGDE